MFLVSTLLCQCRRSGAGLPGRGCRRVRVPLPAQPGPHGRANAPRKHFTSSGSANPGGLPALIGYIMDLVNTAAEQK